MLTILLILAIAFFGLGFVFKVLGFALGLSLSIVAAVVLLILGGIVWLLTRTG